MHNQIICWSSGMKSWFFVPVIRFKISKKFTDKLYIFSYSEAGLTMKDDVGISWGHEVEFWCDNCFPIRSTQPVSLLICYVNIPSTDTLSQSPKLGLKAPNTFLHGWWEIQLATGWKEYCSGCIEIYFACRYFTDRFFLS